MDSSVSGGRKEKGRPASEDFVHYWARFEDDVPVRWTFRVGEPMEMNVYRFDGRGGDGRGGVAGAGVVLLKGKREKTRLRSREQMQEKKTKKNDEMELFTLGFFFPFSLGFLLRSLCLCIVSLAAAFVDSLCLEGPHSRAQEPSRARTRRSKKGSAFFLLLVFLAFKFRLSLTLSS